MGLPCSARSSCRRSGALFWCRKLDCEIKLTQSLHGRRSRRITPPSSCSTCARCSATTRRASAKFSLRLGDLLLDYSKTASARKPSAAVTLAGRPGCPPRSGACSREKINSTERRAALHTALRTAPVIPFTWTARMSADVRPCWADAPLSDAVRSGEHRGIPETILMSSTSASAAPTSAR